MEIFDANVLIQLVTEQKKHYNVSRANIGLIVHVCHKMSTPEVKYEMQPRNSQNSSFKLRSLTESPARTSIKRA